MSGDPKPLPNSVRTKSYITHFTVLSMDREMINTYEQDLTEATKRLHIVGINAY